MELQWDKLYVNMKKANKDNFVNFNIVEDEVEIDREIVELTHKNQFKYKREFSQINPSSNENYIQTQHILNKQLKYK